MIKVITSKDNKRVKFALSLKENKYKKLNKMFLAETFKSLEMALEAKMVVETFSLEKLDIDENIVQNIVNEDILKKLSTNVNPEGVVFIAKEQEIEVNNPNKVLYLDHISDPGNMGTIVRTALAFDYDLIGISEDSVSIYNEKVVNSSKGAIFKMPIKRIELSSLKASHQIIVSTLDNQSVELESLTYQKPFVLVLGNESHGVSEKTLSLADLKVKISIKNIDSLNVAIAGGILMNKIH